MVFFDSILNYVLVRVHVFKHYSQDMLFVNSPLLMLTVSNQANDFPIEKYPVELHLNPISVNGTVCKFREKNSFIYIVLLKGGANESLLYVLGL